MTETRYLGTKTSESRKTERLSDERESMFLPQEGRWRPDARYQVSIKYHVCWTGLSIDEYTPAWKSLVRIKDCGETPLAPTLGAS